MKKLFAVVLALLCTNAYAAEIHQTWGTNANNPAYFETYDQGMGDYRHLMVFHVGDPAYVEIDGDFTKIGPSGETLNTLLNDTAPHSHVATDITDSSSTGRSVLTASSAAIARSAIGAGTSSFDGQYTSLASIPTTFAPSTHSHPATGISDSTTIGRTVLTATDAAAVRTAIGVSASSATIGTGAAIVDTATNAATDAATNAATDAATNAATNLGTSYGLVDGLLGIANALNSANAAQNDLGTKYNALATKYNDAATKYNAAAAKYNAAAVKYNDAATKLNTLINMLEARNVPAAN